VTNEKKPQDLSVSFSVPTPEPVAETADKTTKVEAPIDEPVSTLPALEIDLGSAPPPPDEIEAATREETAIMALDADDPTALLAGQFGSLPGVNHARAAKMATRTNGALHNLNVRARRDLDLARRQALREMGLGNGKKQKNADRKRNKKRR
jgi:hypothetical protein